jgi:8-oxo-dGTP pyrophosphatase MutT (NUDIX family)
MAVRGRDLGEAPHEACAREIKEEIGLDLAVGNLLVLDYEPANPFVSAPMSVYVFDCGTVTEPNRIRLQESELEAFDFVPVDEAAAEFHAANAPRLAHAAEARRTGRTAYVPQGDWLDR